MNQAQQRQFEYNAITRDNWNRGAAHRETITALLSRTSEASQTLGVLGAGNGNDIDLKRLLQVFRQITLVDFDTEALQYALHFQLGAEHHPAVQLCAKDISGLSDRLSQMVDSNCIDIASLVSACNLPVTAFPGSPFDVTASTCLLSQLIDGVTQCLAPLGQRSTAMHELVFAVRHQHARTLIEQTRPGGRIILVTDFVSSDTAPELNGDVDLKSLLPALIANHNFFTGLNPAAIKRLLVSDPEISPLIADVTCSLPWKWQLGPRAYGVVAFEMTKRPALT